MLVILFRDLICRLFLISPALFLTKSLYSDSIFIAVSWLSVLEMVSFKGMMQPIGLLQGLNTSHVLISILFSLVKFKSYTHVPITIGFYVRICFVFCGVNLRGQHLHSEQAHVMVSLSDIEQDWWFHVCDFAALNTTSRAGFNTRQVYLQ